MALHGVAATPKLIIMYTVLIHGVEVVCSEASEAFALARLASNVSEADAPRRPGRPPINGESAAKSREKESTEKTLVFLKRLFEAGSAGISGDQLADAISLKGKRGIGGVLKRMRKVLDVHKIPPGEVFTMRGERGNRRWKQSSRIAEAISRLEGKTHGAG
jgi:hypothetical protein